MKLNMLTAKTSMPAIIVSGAIAAALPQAAQAARVVVPPCDASLVVGASECVGYYDGNLLGGSRTKIAMQTAAIADLNANYKFDGNFNSTTKVERLTNGNTIDFGTQLTGKTVIGIHFGNVAGPAGNVTAFYLFDFGTEGAGAIALRNTMGFSNAVLYNTGGIAGAVPEPAAWMLMILAFGAMGTALRIRNANRKRIVSVSFA